MSLSSLKPEFLNVKNKRYAIQSRLGGGGFCEVAKAIDTLTMKEVAIKVLDNSKPIFKKGKKEVIDRKLRALMRREATIMKDLNHPNIIKFYDIYEDSDECFIVIELVTGGELYDRIFHEHRIPESITIEIVKQLLSAVGYMHEKGYIHRDIKPENILFEKPGVNSILKLADMGLSRTFEDVMFTNCGTIDYCAPELLMNRVERNGYGKEIDIWSIGVVVYVTLSGYQPFITSTQNEEDLKLEIICGHYKFHKAYWNSISTPAKMFIASILKVDPKKRASLNKLINHAWLHTDLSKSHEESICETPESTTPTWHVSCLIASAVLEFASFCSTNKTSSK